MKGNGGPGVHPTLAEQLAAWDVAELSKRLQALPQCPPHPKRPRTDRAEVSSECTAASAEECTSAAAEECTAASAEKCSAASAEECTAAAAEGIAKSALVDALVAAFDQAPAACDERVENRRARHAEGAPVEQSLLTELLTALEAMEWPNRRQRKAPAPRSLVAADENG